VEKATLEMKKTKNTQHTAKRGMDQEKSQLGGEVSFLLTGGARGNCGKKNILGQIRQVPSTVRGA